MIVVEESDLPHEHLIVLAIYVTVGLSVLAHGLTAAPLASRYAGWYASHPPEKAPPMESAPAEVTRPRGPAARHPVGGAGEGHTNADTSAIVDATASTPSTTGS